MRAWLKGIAFVAALAAAAVMAQTNGHRSEIVATMSGGVATPTPTPTPTPTDPAPGYSAWFDAGSSAYLDYPPTVLATSDGDAVLSWKAKAGTYTNAFPSAGGFTTGTFRLAANGINGQPAVTSTAANNGKYCDVLSASALGDGTLMSASSGTVFSVVQMTAIDAAWYRSAWGENANGMAHALYDSGGPKAVALLRDAGGLKLVQQTVPNPTDQHILTWHHESGLLYSGVDDTRTASMASGVAGDTIPANSPCVLAGHGGIALGAGRVAELIFYPTALTQPDRKITERYLAAKYGIALPY